MRSTRVKISFLSPLSIIYGTTNEPNFKIVCNCIHELLNVSEDSAQREHTIVLVFSYTRKGARLQTISSYVRTITL